MPGSVALSAAVIIGSLAGACSSSDSDPSEHPPEHTSADPRVGAGGGGGASGSGGSFGGTGGASGGSGSSEIPGEPEDPASAIEEADIVEIEGDRLYALSRHGGLSVIDLSEGSRLSALGRHKGSALPLEMYVREGVVLGLYRDNPEYHQQEDGQRVFVQQSSLITLDARDPSEIVELGRLLVPGVVVDSSLIGHVLYLVAFEDGSCGECQGTARTRVLSLDVTDPANVIQVDEVTFEQDTAQSFRRSLFASTERLYVSGPSSSEGTLQVVDLSDSSGEMRLGTEVEVNGQISDRWLLDEHEGVLRVITEGLTLQTLQVVSSNEIVPLGSTTLTLPHDLESVRFDGERAYALTSEPTDPVFTIDLSDPANPMQRGELVLPGRLNSLQPRGERLIGLGFDDTSAGGSVTVSLSDVSDLAAPSMIARVSFGAEWSAVAAAQEGFDKALQVNDADGLILVPFSGFDAEHAGCRGERFRSGVQLVEWRSDELTLGGAVRAVGQMRRGLVHDGRLLTLTDQSIETFDIADRSRPQRTDGLALTQNVFMAAAIGEGVARVGVDYWTDRTEVDIASLAAADDPSVPAILDLPMLDADQCRVSNRIDDIQASESKGYVLYTRQAWGSGGGLSYQGRRVLVLDLSDPTAPSVAEDVEIIPLDDALVSYYRRPNDLLVESGARSVAHGTGLSISMRAGGPMPRDSLLVVDLADPAAPRTTNVELEAGLGFTGLLTSGPLVVTSHYVAAASEGRVHFYLDRIDVTDPSEPVLLPRVSIPGSLVAFDAERSRAITVDYAGVEMPSVTRADCYDHHAGLRFEVSEPAADALGTCHTIQQSFHLLRITDRRASTLDSYPLELGERASATALGDDRLFVATIVGRPNPIEELVPVLRLDDSDTQLLVLSGLGSDSLTAARLEVPRFGSEGGYTMVASGTMAALADSWNGTAKLSLIDARDPTDPRLAREATVTGYLKELDVVGTTAIASLGEDGLTTFSLEP